MFCGSDTALGFGWGLGPEFRRQDGHGQPAKAKREIVQAAKIVVNGNFGAAQDVEQIAGGGLHEWLVTKVHVSFRFHGACAAALRAGFAVGLHLIHDGLPGTRAHLLIARGEVGAGNLNVEMRLPEGFVLGVEQRVGFALVARAQAGLFACGRVLARVNAGPAKQDETELHVHA